jgi:hypothetical protein
MTISSEDTVTGETVAEEDAAALAADEEPEEAEHPVINKIPARKSAVSFFIVVLRFSIFLSFLCEFYVMNKLQFRQSVHFPSKSLEKRWHSF